MSRTVNYRWRVYGASAQNPDAQDCQMDGYFTDPEHSPPQWQEIVTGAAKLAAIQIVLQDKREAEAIPNGEGYNESTLNASLRWYDRRSKKTGNSWEVVLDENGVEQPNPCLVPLDPRDLTYALSNVTVRVRHTQVGNATKLSILTEGFLPQA